MPVPSLADLCRKTILANIDEVAYVSTLPYESARDFLVHVKSPSQLATIEENSPQISGEDGELWERFVKRDFRVAHKRKQYGLADNGSWREIYERYEGEEAEEAENAMEQIRATMAGLNKKKEENKTSIADPRSVPKIGRSRNDVRTRTKGFGSGSATLTWGGGKREANLVQKSRKQALEHAAMMKLSKPVMGTITRPRQAPKAMLNEYRIKKLPKFNPTPAVAVAKRPREEDGNERAQLEARLLAAKKARVSCDDKLERSGTATSRHVESRKPVVAPLSRAAGHSPANKTTRLFPSAHDHSRQENKVIKTVERPASTSSSRSANSLKPLPRGAVRIQSSPSAVSPPSRPSVRPGRPCVPSVAAKKSDPRPVSTIPSSGGDYKALRARSSSVASDLFGSPKSDRSKSPAPVSAIPNSSPPTRRVVTAPVAARVPEKGQRRLAEPQVRNNIPAVAETIPEASAFGGVGRAGSPPRKRRPVDIFMRPTKRAR